MKPIPVYMVFVLYLIISSNFLAQLFSCRLQHALQDNMLLKHFMGFMTLLFFVVLASGNDYTATTAVGYSAIIYLLFWISTRMPMPYFQVFIFLSAILYIIHLYKAEKNNAPNKRLDNISQVLEVFIYVVLAMGFLFYLVEKQLEYKKYFSFWTFMIGKPECRRDKAVPLLSGKDMIQFIRTSVLPKK